MRFSSGSRSRFRVKHKPRLGSRLRPRFRIKRKKEDFGDFSHPSLNYRAPRSLKVFRFGTATILSIALVVGGWTLYWSVLANVVKKQATRWVASQNANGGEAGYSDLSLGGFPTRVNITFKEPAFATPAGKKSSLRWSSERLSLSVGIFSPLTIYLEGAGRFRLTARFPGNDGAPRVQHYRGRAKTLAAELEPGSAWPGRLVLNVAGLSLRDNAGGRIAAEQLNLELSTDTDAAPNAEALNLHFAGRDLVLPWATTAPLAPNMQRLEFALGLSGPITDGLKAWQAADGKAKVKNLVVETEGATLAAMGDAVLDDHLQPHFQLAAKVGGLLPMLNRLRDQGYIRDSDAVLVKMTLAALSRRGADGRTVLNLSIEARDGELYLGPVRVGPMPMVDWSIIE